MSPLSRTLQILLVRFDGQILIPFVEASRAAGIAGQTARNKLSQGVFPIETVTNGGRRFIHLEDLANYIESLRQPEQQPKSKRGARTKKARIEAGGAA